MLGVGIIGAGGMGACHAANFSRLQEVRVAAVMDTDSGRAGEVAGRVRAEVLSDAGELIRHPAVQGVVVASPDPTHAALTLACIGAGKPVLCEKPLGVTSLEAKAVVDAESAGARRLVQVGFMREYDPGHAAVAAEVRSGRVGDPMLVSSLHNNVAGEAPRAMTDVVIQSMIHDLHSVRFLSGREIQEVHCRVAAAAGHPGTANLAMVSLRLAGGCLGLIVMNSASRETYRVNAEVVGTAGVAATTTKRDENADHHWLTRFEEAYRREAEVFVASLAAGAATGPSAWDGFVSLVAAEACIESVRTGHSIAISLPQRPLLYGEG